MSYKRRQIHNEEGTDAWLMSYADMITLLLCFFIIFVSVSEPKEKFLAAAVEGLSAKFGSVNIANPFNAVFRAMDGLIDQNELYRDVAIEHIEKGMEIELSAARFFQPNSAEINPGAETVLAQMSTAFKEAEFMEYTLTIEGHTDDAPLAGNPNYATNWDLSSARAVALVKFFEAHGIKSDRLRAVGFAGSKPKVPNTATDGAPIEENRLRNQRMVVRFERVTARN